jgi:hypothetical protein
MVTKIYISSNEYVIQLSLLALSVSTSGSETILDRRGLEGLPIYHINQLFSLAKITRQNLLCPDHIVVTAAGE